MNDIQVDLKSLPIDVRKFVRSEIKIANDNEIGVKLLNKRHAWMDGVRVNGYFCDATPELVVACYKKTNEWLEIFVHESCHRDQFIENARVWTRTINGYDATTLLWQWLDKTIELTPEKLNTVVQHVLEIELDCERRAARKIRRFNLPIDLDEYIKKANAYVYFYKVLEETRLWYDKGRSPMHCPAVWKQMPNHFNNDYKIISPKYRAMILEHCYDR